LLATVAEALIKVLQVAITSLIKRRGISLLDTANQSFKGKPTSTHLISVDGEIEDSDDEKEQVTEEYLHPSLKIRGKSALFKADYIMRKGGEVEVDGVIEAQGRDEKSRAYLIYEIRGTVEGQEWCGVLMLDFTSWEEVYGFFLTPSGRRRHKGKVVLGRVDLVRQA